MKIEILNAKKCISNILNLDISLLTNKKMAKIINNNLHNKVGKVYIATMSRTKKWPEIPENVKKLNVTSAQGKDNENRRDFSPMTEVKGGYRGFYNFESFWQSGKVFDHENLPENKTKDWWLKNKEPKRRYSSNSPISKKIKIKNVKVKYSKWKEFPDEKMGYIESRKKVYVPFYFDYMKDKEMAKKWKIRVNNGENVVIYDYDGPKTKNGYPDCHEVSLEYLKEKINDPQFPFGHGYVVAAWLLNIKPEEYII
jgi:hypothetical protein